MAIRTPLAELQDRIGKLQQELRRESIAGALLVQRADLFYFSGTGQNAHLFVPAEGEPLLLVKKSLARAKEESALELVTAADGLKQVTALIAEKIPKGSSIGLETDVLPANLYFRYHKLLEGYKLADLSGAVRRIRAIKSKYEISLMRQAAEVATAVFDYARQIIRAGMREIELAGQLEMQARRLGHQGAIRMRGFNQEIYFGHIMSGADAAVASFFDGPTGGSGLNSSYPQGAGMSLIKKRAPILIDFVTVLGGYMVDQTRIFSIGEPASHLREAYTQAVLIKHTLAGLGKEGACGSDLYHQAWEMVSLAGLEKHFMGCGEQVSFIGHGVGLELDELPVIARNLAMPLTENMVFALEPKFIFPGEGVVGTEDTFFVGPEKLEPITCYSDDLQII